jgi:hypothetical protein
MLDSGVDLKKATFQPDADVMTLDELLHCGGDIRLLDEGEGDTYMKLAATIDPVSWDNVVAEPFPAGVDYALNSRLAREAINVGREAEILALTCDDATCNILDAALFQCGGEFLRTDSPECCTDVGADIRDYLYEPAKLLCLELVKHCFARCV